MGLPYLSLGPDSTAIHDFSVVTRDLTRRASKLSERVSQEIVAGIEGTSGSAEKWDNVQPAKATAAIAERVVLRVFFGEQVCRDPGLHESMHKWEMALGMLGLI